MSEAEMQCGGGGGGAASLAARREELLQAATEMRAQTGAGGEPRGGSGAVSSENDEPTIGSAVRVPVAGSDRRSLDGANRGVDGQERAEGAEVAFHSMCGSGLPPREEALMLAAELLVLERDVRQRAVAAPDALRGWLADNVLASS